MLQFENALTSFEGARWKADVVNYRVGKGSDLYTRAKNKRRVFFENGNTINASLQQADIL